MSRKERNIDISKDRLSEAERQYLELLEKVFSGEIDFSPQAVRGQFSIFGFSELPAPIADAILMLAHVEYHQMDEGAMAVRLDPKRHMIFLDVDIRYLVPFLIMQKSDSSLFKREVGRLLHHELAHILLGHLDGLEWEFADPMMVLAKEIAVNDGWLRIDSSVYPFVRLDAFPFADKVRKYAEEHNYPDDWLQRHLLIYRALVNTVDSATMTTKGAVSELLQRWSEYFDNQRGSSAGGNQSSDEDSENTTGASTDQSGESKQSQTQVGGFQVHDHTGPLPDSAQVLVVRQGNEVHIFPVVPHPAPSSDTHQMIQDVHESLKDSLLQDGHYQYDTLEQSFRYSPDGFAEKDRIITQVSYHVAWHEIKRLFGVKKSLGYDRRTGHLHPPDESPLVTKRPVRKTVYVFYDSSGSVPDEVLSGFIHTARRSPFRIKEFYFSTQVTDHPHTGGTDFKCIEEFIQEQGDYPDTVVVLTDGDAAANFHPQYPERWYWIVKGNPSAPEKIGGKVILIKERSSF